MMVMVLQLVDIFKPGELTEILNWRAGLKVGRVAFTVSSATY